MPKRDEKNMNSGENTSPARRDDIFPRDFFNMFFDDSRIESRNPWRALQLGDPLSRRWFPKMDISETDTEVKVSLDLPGVNPDDVSIDIRDNRLRVSGTTEREKTDEKPYRYERTYGRFERQVTLPTHVKEEEVQAKYKDGVLNITLPKSEEDKAKKIFIERQ